MIKMAAFLSRGLYLYSISIKNFSYKVVKDLEPYKAQANPCCGIRGEAFEILRKTLASSLKFSPSQYIDISQHIDIINQIMVGSVAIIGGNFINGVFSRYSNFGFDYCR